MPNLKGFGNTRSNRGRNSEAAQRVVLLAATSNVSRTPEARAVARLAAEAPVLRDCLRAFVDFHAGHVLPPELAGVMNGARAAIARAEGEGAE